MNESNKFMRDQFSLLQHVLENHPELKVLQKIDYEGLSCPSCGGKAISLNRSGKLRDLSTKSPAWGQWSSDCKDCGLKFPNRKLLEEVASCWHRRPEATKEKPATDLFTVAEVQEWIMGRLKGWDLPEDNLAASTLKRVACLAEDPESGLAAWKERRDNPTRCGTCKHWDWRSHLHSKSMGVCRYPIPKVPLWLEIKPDEDSSQVQHADTLTCPCWEKKEPKPQTTESCH